MIRFRPVQRIRRHPLAADCVLAAVLTVMGVATLWGRAVDIADTRDPDVLGIILAIGATAPMALRRRHPIAVLSVVASSQFALEIRSYGTAGWMPMFLAVYTVAAHTSGVRRTRTMEVFGAAALTLLVAGLFRGLDVGQFVSSIVFLIGAFILGDNLQRRRRQGAEAAERARIATRERDLLARQQVQDERARIARELHDVVAHSVSLMIIQAGAARRSISSAPLRAEAALHELESTGRSAMEELRRVLGVLRTGEADDAVRDLAPQPTLNDVRALIDDDPFLHVDYVEVGRPASDIPPSVGVSLYRVVQEALTNVRKHSGQVRHVGVRVAYEPERVTVQVTDDGRGASVDVNAGGHGLIGMRERMALCGGTVHAGPRSGGGWQVRAAAPLSPATLPHAVRATATSTADVADVRS